MRRAARLWPWAVLLLAGGFLHFKNLGETALWQDEAETAVLARNVLKFGVPKVHDGLNLVSQNQGRDHDERLLMNHLPWLPFYLTAASLALLGESAFAARAPFAALGLLNVFLLYRLMRRWGRGEGEARLGAALLLFSVPHVLFARQCRYYMLAEAFALLLWLAYEDFLDGKRRAGPLMAAGLLGLFHSSYFVLSVIGGGLALHFTLAVKDKREALGRFAGWIAATALLLLPGVLYFGPFGKAAGEAAALAGGRLGNWKALLLDLDLYVLPSGVLALAWAARKRWKDWERPLLFLGGGLLVLIVSPRYFTRYSVILVPLCAALFAAAASGLWSRRRAYAAVFVALLLGTRALSASAWAGAAPLLNGDWPGLWRELTRPFPEPIKEASRLLNERARPGELLLVSFPDIPFMFYTKLRVVGGLSGPQRLDKDEIAWILLRGEEERRFWPVDWRRYERIPLSGPDAPWGNRPDPGHHMFRPGFTGGSPALYRLKSAG